MATGLILLVGAEATPDLHTPFGERGVRGPTNLASAARGVGGPIECVEILGSTMLDRHIETFLENSSPAAFVCVLFRPGVAVSASRYASNPKVRFRPAEDIWFAAVQTLLEFSEQGIEYALVAKANVYAEFDVMDLMEFHRGSHRSMTSVGDALGPLGIWITSCARHQTERSASAVWTRQDAGASHYFVSNYTHRLHAPQDLRSLATDALRGTCSIRPNGREIRSGVFVASGAQIHRRARLVAPAFVGRNSKIREDALVTRCSTVESDCYIDCGTTVEDSSILSNTYVGLCLDVAHSVVRGKTLFNVGREVELEVSDDRVLRDNGAVVGELAHDPLRAFV